MENIVNFLENTKLKNNKGEFYWNASAIYPLFADYLDAFKNLIKTTLNVENNRNYFIITQLDDYQLSLEAILNLGIYTLPNNKQQILLDYYVCLNHQIKEEKKLINQLLSYEDKIYSLYKNLNELNDGNNVLSILINSDELDNYDKGVVEKVREDEQRKISKEIKKVKGYKRLLVNEYNQKRS